jgi:hypothetical protein
VSRQAAQILTLNISLQQRLLGFESPGARIVPPLSTSTAKTEWQK